RVRVGGRQAIDHRPGRVDPGRATRWSVRSPANRDDRIQRPVHIPHGSNSPGEIPRRSPAGSLGQVGVRIDQAGNNPAAGDIYLVDAPGKLESGPRSDGFDLTATDYYRGVGQRRPTGSVDQGGAYQR